METILLIGIGLGLAIWGFLTLHKKGVENFWRILRETNDAQGTLFGVSQADSATVVGTSLYSGGVIAFDTRNRKIAFLSKGGKSVQIFGYGFVRSWKIVWREKQSGSGARFGLVTVGSMKSHRDHVFLEIQTNDIQLPIIRMPMSSVRFAEESSARLDIMINSKS